MVETDFPEIFYKGSPFLPLVGNDDVIEAVKRMNAKKVSLLGTSAEQAGHIGTALNLTHEVLFSQISNSFGCEPKDLLLFYIGFTTPVQLILSGIQLNTIKTKIVIENLTLPTKLEAMQRHNRYKVSLLHDAYYIIINKPEEKLITTVTNIRTLCHRKPFSLSKYYIAGVDAGCHTIKLLIDKIQKHKQTPQ